MTIEIRDPIVWTDAKDGLLYCDEEKCLAILLANEILMCNERDTTFMGKPDCATTVLYILCNDTFQYSCGDAEPLLNDDIGPLTKLFLQWGGDGAIKWVALCRGKRPLLPIVERMKKEGHWDAELEALPT
jgi:hypothetical protein